jgi:hypothetical protein
MSGHIIGRGEACLARSAAGRQQAVGNETVALRATGEAGLAPTVRAT